MSYDLKGTDNICKEFVTNWIYFGEIALENHDLGMIRERPYQHHPLKLKSGKTYQFNQFFSDHLNSKDNIRIEVIKIIMLKKIALES